MSNTDWDSVIAKVVAAHSETPSSDLRSIIGTVAPEAEADPAELVDQLREKVIRLSTELGNTRSPYEATKVGSELQKHIRTLRSFESALAATH